MSAFLSQPWIQLLRPHQWSKNFLLFLPLVAGHRWGDPEKLGFTLLGFVAACLAASFVYILNDLRDREEDRLHPVKSRRPLASGSIRPRTALSLAIVLFLGASALCLWLPSAFALTLGAYWLLSLAYIYAFRRLPGWDLPVLTFLYLLRIFMGGAASGIWPSLWLLALAFCCLASLALMKRVSELVRLRDSGTTSLPGRGYRISWLSRCSQWGGGMAVLGVMVLAAYAFSPQADLLYRQPIFLAFAAPLLALWFARAWHITLRGDMPSDPVVFALRDPSSYLLAAGILLCTWLAG